MEVLGNRVIVPPEVKSERMWHDDVSLAYLLGISILFAVAPEKCMNMYLSNNLYDKIHYEKLVRNLVVNNEIKALLLNLLAPVKSRISIYDAGKVLQNSERDVVKRDVKIKAVKVVNYNKKWYETIKL